MSQVRDLVRKGIPHHFRGMAWQVSSFSASLWCLQMVMMIHCHHCNGHDEHHKICEGVVRSPRQQRERTLLRLPENPECLWEGENISIVIIVNILIIFIILNILIIFILIINNSRVGGKTKKKYLQQMLHIYLVYLLRIFASYICDCSCNLGNKAKCCQRSLHLDRWCLDRGQHHDYQDKRYYQDLRYESKHFC